MSCYKISCAGILLIVFISCRSLPKNESNIDLKLTNGIGKTTSDTLKQRNNNCEYSILIASQLGLKELHSGVDSVVIRFWYGHSLGLYRNVLILDASKHGWNAELINMRVAYDYSIKDYKVTEYKKKRALPISGWEKLIQSINTLNVLSFSNSDKYNLVEPGADGGSYVIEIANKKSYDFYCFIEPKSYSNKFVTAKKLVELYELLETEFSFKFGHYNVTPGTSP